MAHISIELDATPEEIVAIHDTLAVLLDQGVLRLRNGSANLWFDDVGLLQKIDFDRTRKRRDGESLQVLPCPKGTAIINYEENGDIGRINYKTSWRRGK